MHLPKISSRWGWIPGLTTLAVCIFLLFFQLGDEPIFGDETLYVRVATKTLQTGQWLPILARPYAFVEKPPLTVWGAAAGMGLAGPNELGARWVNGVVALLLCGVTAHLALRLGNRWTMALAPLLLVTAPGLLLEHGLRSAVPEAWLLLAVTAAFAWFLESDAKSPAVRLGGLALLSLFAGWTKGLVGPVVVGVALFVVELVAPADAPADRTLSSPKRRLHRAAVSATAAALPGILIYLGWLLFSLGSVEAMQSFLHRDLWVRAGGGRDPNDLQPVSIYFRAAWENFGILALLGPLMLAGGVVRDAFRPGPGSAAEQRSTCTLLLWSAVVLTLFSIPRARLPWYSYPAYPALAIAAALALDRLRRWLRDGRSRRGRLAGTAAFALLLGLLCAARAEALRRAWPPWEPRSLLALQRILDADPAARAYAEAGLAQGEYARTHVVEWQRFYLRRFLELPQPELPADAPACSFVVTARPDAWQASLAARAPGARLAATAPIAGAVPGWLTLYVLDFCGGRFAGSTP